MNTPIRIAIVDPYDLVRDAVKFALNDCPDLHFVGEAESAGQMLSLCEVAKPDVVLFDFGSNDEDIAVIEQLRDQYQQVKVLVLTANTEIACVRNALRAGARGYICKMGTLTELQQAIVSVNNCHSVIDKTIEHLLSA